MKIIVHDHAPGAGAERQAYLEDRTRRVLGWTAEKVQSITIDMHPDERSPTHCRVEMSVQPVTGSHFRVSVLRRHLDDALADAFDAVSTRIELRKLRLSDSAHALTFMEPPPRAKRARARARW